MKKKEVKTFGGEVGEGIGCFLVLLAIAILFSFPAVLKLVERIIECKK